MTITPCPFCNGKPELEQDRRLWRIRCQRCGHVVEDEFEEHGESNIRMRWNVAATMWKAAFDVLKIYGVEFDPMDYKHMDVSTALEDCAKAIGEES